MLIHLYLFPYLGKERLYIIISVYISCLIIYLMPCFEFVVLIKNQIKFNVNTGM